MSHSVDGFRDEYNGPAPLDVSDAQSSTAETLAEGDHQRIIDNYRAQVDAYYNDPSKTPDQRRGMRLKEAEALHKLADSVGMPVEEAMRIRNKAEVEASLAKSLAQVEALAGDRTAYSQLKADPVFVTEAARRLVMSGIGTGVRTENGNTVISPQAGDFSVDATGKLLFYDQNGAQVPEGTAGAMPAVLDANKEPVRVKSVTDFKAHTRRLQTLMDNAKLVDEEGNEIDNSLYGDVSEEGKRTYPDVTVDGLYGPDTFMADYYAMQRLDGQEREPEPVVEEPPPEGEPVDPEPETEEEGGDVTEKILPPTPSGGPRRGGQRGSRETTPEPVLDSGELTPLEPTPSGGPRRGGRRGSRETTSEPVLDSGELTPLEPTPSGGPRRGGQRGSRETTPEPVLDSGELTPLEPTPSGGPQLDPTPTLPGDPDGVEAYMDRVRKVQAAARKLAPPNLELELGGELESPHPLTDIPGFSIEGDRIVYLGRELSENPGLVEDFTSDQLETFVNDTNQNFAGDNGLQYVVPDDALTRSAYGNQPVFIRDGKHISVTDFATKYNPGMTMNDPIEAVFDAL